MLSTSWQNIPPTERDAPANDIHPLKIPATTKNTSWLSDIIIANLDANPTVICPECSETFPTHCSALTHMKMHMKPFCYICFCQMRSVAELQIHANKGHPSIAHLITKPYSKYLKPGTAVYHKNYLESLPKIKFSSSGRKIQRKEK